MSQAVMPHGRRVVHGVFTLQATPYRVASLLRDAARVASCLPFRSNCRASERKSERADAICMERVVISITLEVNENED